VTHRVRRRLPVIAATTPGRTYNWLRRLTLSLPWIALTLGPLLGGWQRMDRNYLSAWEERGWDLPDWLLQRLPGGEWPATVYESNQLLGGGTGVDYGGIPAIEPTLGVFAMLTGPMIPVLVVAFLLPMLIGLFAGRVFCGWFCPFGSLARAVAALLRRLPGRRHPYALPRSRAARFVLLGVGMTAGLAGMPAVLALLLPHALLQQSIYSLWLMGGGGAALGWFVGLVAAGVVMGPNVYCASLCPTGGVLALLGRTRLVRLTITNVERCGKHCDLCSRACWLALDPARGDPGPDCDNCAQCLRACPKQNLQVGLILPRARRSVLIGLFCVAALLPRDAAATDSATRGAPPRPVLLLESRRQIDDVNLLIAVVREPEANIELSSAPLTTISISAIRGKRREALDDGTIPPRDFYRGPVRLTVHRAGMAPTSLEMKQPRMPRSTTRPSIYRFELTDELGAGDRIGLAEVPGWFPSQQWTIASSHGDSSLVHLLSVFLASASVFGGLMALSLGAKRSTDAGAPAPPAGID